MSRLTVKKRGSKIGLKPVSEPNFYVNVSFSGAYLGDTRGRRGRQRTLPLTTGEDVTELRLRTVSQPDRMMAELLHRLGVDLPERSRVMENVVQKNGLPAA